MIKLDTSVLPIDSTIINHSSSPPGTIAITDKNTATFRQLEWNESVYRTSVHIYEERPRNFSNKVEKKHPRYTSTSSRLAADRRECLFLSGAKRASAGRNGSCQKALEVELVPAVFDWFLPSSWYRKGPTAVKAGRKSIFAAGSGSPPAPHLALLRSPPSPTSFSAYFALRFTPSVATG